jgi:transcriptional regulator with XRE-family HTH domain
MPATAANLLGTYLRSRRTRLDPAALGFTGGRRRTPGLRREEVAQRANISPTWYTWLEQGRGGAPSADVLDRIAEGLMLTAPEREHLFMIGLGHLPEVRFKPSEGVSPRLQRVLDALDASPAIVKTALWDVVAWNRAAAAVFTDYGKLPAAERNILRLIFSHSRARAAQDDWQDIARFVVGAFRADAARAGAVTETQQFVEELSAQSPEFRQMWQANDVNAYGEGTKRLHHASLGLLELEFSAFAVDGRPDLGMVVYNPVTSQDAGRIRAYVLGQPLPA